MVCTPLSVKDHSRLGAVQVLNKSDGKFEAEDLEFVTQFSYQVALAIENAQLYEAVSQRSHQLEMVDGRKNELMNLLAAELRDPVRSISTSAELLGSGALNDGLMVEQTCGNLMSDVQRLSKLISDFRNLSLATATKLSIDIGHCSVAALFVQAQSSFDSMLRGRSVAFQVEGTENAATCEGDINLLHVALSNLISNALRNTPDGGTIILKATRSERFVTIELADSGNGMSTNDIMHAFDGFDRILPACLSSSPYEFRSKGLGLGLPAVRTILLSHGSALEIRSSVGRGSTFYFSLPAV
jgi:signal transduction histidine kinase